MLFFQRCLQRQMGPVPQIDYNKFHFARKRWSTNFILFIFFIFQQIFKICPFFYHLKLFKSKVLCAFLLFIRYRGSGRRIVYTNYNTITRFSSSLDFILRILSSKLFIFVMRCFSSNIFYHHQHISRSTSTVEHRPLQ